jgi:transcriptional regulator with XRE-family HTH domain
MANPTIQRRRLGNALKRAREAAGKTQDEAAVIIDARGSKISRLELGQSGIRLTDLTLLLNFYGIEASEAEALRELARAGRQRGRWGTYRKAIPDWFKQYVELEQDASEIRWYQTEILPGILQTEAYIRVLAGTEDQVKVRQERQAVLDQTETDIGFIISESALRRRVGNETIMREQLTHLITVSELPNVALHILPFDAETIGPAPYPFIMLRFGPDSASEVIYVETATDADYLDSPEDVREYSRLWLRLQAAALGPLESRRLIQRILSEKSQS